MKIANKIALLFLVGGLTLTLVAASLFYAISKRHLEESIHAYLETTVNSRAEHINTFLELYKGSVAQLASDITSQRFLRADKQDRDYGELFGIVTEELIGAKEAGAFIREIFILDANGVIVASSSKSRIGTEMSECPCFLGSRLGPFIRDAYYTKTEGKETLDFSAPITDGQTGQFSGIVVSKINMSALNKITLDRTGLGRTGEIYIVNKYGYMITPSRFIKDTFLKQKVDTVNFRDCLTAGKDPTVHIGHEAVKVSLDYRGLDALGTHRYMPQMQWVLLAQIDAEEALAPLSKINFLFSIILLLVPIGAWLVSIPVSRIVASPIYKLRRGTEVIGKGNLDYKVGTVARDEIGQLSRAFDKMTQDLKGTTTSITRLNKEIGERRIAEQKVRQTAEEWQKTFNSTSDFIFILDKDFTFTRVNRAFAALLKMKPEDIIGKKCYEILHKSDKPWMDCPFDKTAEKRETHITEVYDPNIGIPLLVTTSSLFNEQGELTHIVYVAKDITGLKEIDKMKDEFVNTVSHELRTPLTTMKEFTSIISDEIPGKLTKDQKEYIGIIKNNINRLSRLINDLLDISRIEAGRIELKKSFIDIVALAKGVISVSKTEADKKHVKVESSFQSPLPKVSADADKIVQVFTNLIGNAIKFTPEKGKITVTIRERDRDVECSVADTGIGIAREDLGRVFNKFQQFGREPGGGAKGTGLGLAITKELVYMHKGKIWVESKPGKGSRFIFTLPVREKEV